MKSALGSIVKAMALAMFAAGCNSFTLPPRYVEPEAAKPHALVMVRVSYDGQPDEYSAEFLKINGLHADVPGGNRRLSGVSFGLRTAPGAARWQLGTSFYHLETRMFTETYLDPQYRYVPCSHHDSYAGCVGGTSLERVLRTRSVPRSVPVYKASCSRLGDYSFDAGSTYTLSFKFLADERCVLECREQQAGSDGTTEGAPCKGAPMGFNPEAEHAAAVAQSEGKNENSEPLRSVGTTSIVIGAIALASAAAAGTYAMAKKSEVRAHCDDARSCDADGQDAADKGKTAIKIGSVAGVAGASLLLGGIVFMSMWPRKKPTSASLLAAPADHGGQIAIKGVF